MGFRNWKKFRIIYPVISFDHTEPACLYKNRTWLEEILSTEPEVQLQVLPSPHLCLPLMSICRIARECGWRTSESLPTCQDPCVVCLERKCTVAAEGCDHEFCIRCALYLCSTNCSSTVAKGPPGSIACPLCRHGIVSFVKLPATRPAVREIARTSLSLPFCTCSGEELGSSSLDTPLCNPKFRCSRSSPLGSSFRSLSFGRFPSMKINYSLCKGAPDICRSLVPSTVNRKLRSHLTGCSRSGFRRPTSEGQGSWLSALNQYETTGDGC